MISAWWLLLIFPAAYAGFLHANAMWIKNGYRPKRENPYGLAARPPLSATAAGSDTAIPPERESAAQRQGEPQ